MAIAVLTGTAAGPGSAAEAPVPRTVIALYDSTVTPQWRDTLLHQLAEMPLNHLGLVLEPHDVNEALPDIAARDEVRGIVTWWQGETLPDPQAFLEWARAAADAGKRVVMLGIMAYLSDRDRKPPPQDAVSGLLDRLGMRIVEHGYDVSHTARAVYKVGSMVEYERSLPDGLALFGAMRSIDPANRVYLQVRWPASTEPADLVVTGPRGGVVAENFTHYQVGDSGFRQWYLDPFEFFRQAFDTDALPKPDVTTMAGRRIYFSHVDGDGWRNYTNLQPFRRRGKRAIDVLIDRVFLAYPDLPVTLAPIAGDLDPEWCGDPPAQEAATRAFALPNVEAASHTYSHPFFWSDFADGQPASEIVGNPLCHGMKGIVAERAARAYPKSAFDLDLELSGSVRYIESFLPPGKTAGLVQWSGNTLPFPEALRRLERDGLLNINGGDTRFDLAFPSISWVAPVGRRVDGLWQIYAAASNENTYTRLWTSAFYGFRQLEETLANTETPRRLVPVNIYYHVYSGERLASLNALLANLDYVQGLDVVPIPTTEYVRVARGFYTTRIVATGPRRWRIEDRGSLQTIRFEALIDDEEPDLQQSEGVLGWTHHNGSLYVALDPAHETPEIVLRRPATESSLVRPRLVESRWPVADLETSATGFSFSAGGYGPGKMTWQVSVPGNYRVAFQGSDRASALRVEGADDGTLTFALPAGEPKPMRIDVVAPGGDGS